MKRFVILAYAEPQVAHEMMEQTPEDMEKGKQHWFDWKEKYKAQVVDIGSPLFNSVDLLPDGTTKHNDSQINGYMIIDAETFEDAMSILKDSPLFPYIDGCKIEIHEGMIMEL